MGRCIKRERSNRNNHLPGWGQWVIMKAHGLGQEEKLTSGLIGVGVSTHQNITINIYIHINRLDLVISPRHDHYPPTPEREETHSFFAASAWHAELASLLANIGVPIFNSVIDEYSSSLWEHQNFNFLKGK
ncbi:hypothetical protein Tco_0531848 [Tanacetum coccineum]